MAVRPPTFIDRPAHPANYTKGRPLGRDGRFTFHHVVGSAESAATVFANPARQASATWTVTAIVDVVMRHLSINDSPWSDGNSDSNLKTCSAEHHGDWRFGYRNEVVIENSARLLAWLRDTGVITHYYRHWQVSLLGTQCCCDLPVEEIWNRASAIIAAESGGAPAPLPAPVGSPIRWTAYPEPKQLRTNKEANLWRFDKVSWDQFNHGAIVKTLKAGDVIDIAGEGYNPALDATYLVTKFSLDGKIANGFNASDLTEVVEAPATIRWEPLSAPRTYELIRNTELWDFNRTAWHDIADVGDFKQGDRFVAVAVCHNDTLGASYAVTEYSYSTRSTIGVNLKDLTEWTPPAPVAPSVPEWKRNLKDIEPIKLTVLVPQTPVVHLESGTQIKQLGAGTNIDFVKSTTVGGVEYLISSYSASVGAAQGIARSDVGLPEVPKNDKPEWLLAWEDIVDVTMYARADTDVVNLDNGETVKTLKRGEKVDVASTTEWRGHKYAITQYSTDKQEGRGIRIDDLDIKPITGPPAPSPEQPTVETRVSWLEKKVADLRERLGIKE